MVHYERTWKKNRCFFFMESHDDQILNQALAAQPTFGAQTETLQISFWFADQRFTQPKTNMETQNDGLEKVAPFTYGYFWYLLLNFWGVSHNFSDLGHSSSQGLCSKGKRSISSISFDVTFLQFTLNPWKILDKFSGSFTWITAFLKEPLLGSGFGCFTQKNCLLL